MDYQKYMDRENFLENREDALLLISYLVGFWEVKQNELDSWE